MTTVGEIAAWMDRVAPRQLAEDWDNVGLLWGDPASRIDAAMTCLTVTRESADEAVADGAGLIVSHHPILFRPTQAVRADDPPGSILWSLARAGVAVISHHTAFDNAVGGCNDALARRAGLVEVGPLAPSPASAGCKVVVTAPAEAVESVLSAAFRAGAGRVGGYDECSFSTPGVGTFFGGVGTNPAVGRPGRREEVEERRVELTCAEGRVDAVVAAIRSAHPYETPAIDAYPLRPAADGPGVGRLGRLPGPVVLDAFAEAIAGALGASAVEVVGEPNSMVRRVGVACGAGDGFVGLARRAGADVLVTGEARFHRALEARSSGLGLVTVGHHASERPGVEDLAARLSAAFPGLRSWASWRESDPLRRVRRVADDQTGTR